MRRFFGLCSLLAAFSCFSHQWKSFDYCGPTFHLPTSRFSDAHDLNGDCRGLSYIKIQNVEQLDQLLSDWRVLEQDYECSRVELDIVTPYFRYLHRLLAMSYLFESSVEVCP